MDIETPASLRGKLTSRAREDSRRTGVSVSELVQQYVFQRLLARVFQQDGWLLKGGQALLVRYPTAARNSRDIDLIRPGRPDLEQAAQALENAARVDLGDFFRFTPGGRSLHDGSAEVRFTAQLGAATWQIKVDLVVSRTVTSVPVRKPLVPAVSLPWPADSWPDVVLYPIADHIADKVCAMYEWHGQGKPSTRFRDLADLLLISQQESLTGKEIVAAIAGERIRRPACGIDLRLPDAFEIPDQPSWVRGYAKAARDVVGLAGCATLAEAEAAAAIFVTPLLGSADPGFWDPAAPDWRPENRPASYGRP